MELDDKYSISTEVMFEALTLIDIPKGIESCSKKAESYVVRSE